MAERAPTTDGHPLRTIGPLGRLSAPQFGVLVFISSEAFFFLTLITTYITYRGEFNAPQGPTPHDLNVPLTALFTVFLLSSSATMGIATARLGRADARGARVWLYFTVLLGAAFLLGQGYEYLTLYREGAPIFENLWTSAFYTLTGFHGLHVLIGLISILIVAGVIRAEAGGIRGLVAAESVALYWHFVDAVWVVIFPVVYLWTLIS